MESRNGQNVRTHISSFFVIREHHTLLYMQLSNLLKLLLQIFQKVIRGFVNSVSMFRRFPRSLNPRLFPAFYLILQLKDDKKLLDFGIHFALLGVYPVQKKEHLLIDTTAFFSRHFSTYLARRLIVVLPVLWTTSHFTGTYLFISRNCLTLRSISSRPNFWIFFSRISPNFL